jgi:hypothetical protein
LVTNYVPLLVVCLLFAFVEPRYGHQFEVRVVDRVDSIVVRSLEVTTNGGLPLVIAKELEIPMIDLVDQNDRLRVQMLDLELVLIADRRPDCWEITDLDPEPTGHPLLDFEPATTRKIKLDDLEFSGGECKIVLRAEVDVLPVESEVGLVHDRVNPLVKDLGVTMQVDIVLATVFGYRTHESGVWVTHQDQNCEFIQVEYLTKVVDRDVSHVHDPAEFRVPRLMPELNVMVMQMGHHLTNSGSRNLGIVREDESVLLTDNHDC